MTNTDQVFGLKISKPNKNVLEADVRDIIYSSKYQTFRIFKQGAGTLTDSTRTITIPHGLGYVPLFLFHTQLDEAVTTPSTVGDPDDYFISPFRINAGIGIGEAENTHDILAYADRQNLYIQARSNVGKEFYAVSNTGNLNECVAYEDDFGYTTGAWVVGNDSSTGQNVEDGALRFGPSGIFIDQGFQIYNAQLNLFVGGRKGSGEVKMRIFGIDEDDTVPFNTGSAATARGKTSASADHNSTVLVGQFTGKDVTAIVQEIVDRAGWASGNQLGFILNDNGTVASNDYFEDAGVGGVASNLEIMKSSTLAQFKYTIFLNKVAD